MESYRTTGNFDQSEDRELNLPPRGKRVMVDTANFRCLGYLDLQGVWRQSFSDKPLERVIGWESIDAPEKN